MNGKRLLHTLRLWTISTGAERAKYLAKKKIFAYIGKNCTIMDRKIPLYANLIKIGDNVQVASNVPFVTLDITPKMLNWADPERRGKPKFAEKIGCIEVGSNVFIGSGTTILYDVKIGSNVIVGAGSVVTRDIPDNSIAVGVPAKVISTLDHYVGKRIEEKTYRTELRPRNQEVGPELESWCWSQFREKHS